MRHIEICKDNSTMLKVCNDISRHSMDRRARSSTVYLLPIR